MTNIPYCYIPFSHFRWTPAPQPPPPPSQQTFYPADIPYIFSQYAWHPLLQPPLPQPYTPIPSVANASLNPSHDLGQPPPPKRQRKTEVEYILNPRDEDVRKTSFDIQDDLFNLGAASAQPFASFDEKDNHFLLEAGKKQSIDTFDWDLLAQETIDGKYSSACCRVQYLKIISVKQPTNQGWSPEEDYVLRSAHLRWNGAWQEISALYFLGTRTSEDCLVRWNQIPHSVPIEKLYQDFDPSDNQALLTAFRKQNLDDFDENTLQKAMKYKYSPMVCKNQLLSLLKVKRRSTSKWSAEEDEKLRKGVAKCETVWKEVSALYFEGERTPADCIKRWKEYVNPALKRADWTQSDTDLILAYIKNPTEISLYEFFKGERPPTLLYNKLRNIKNIITRDSKKTVKPSTFQETDTPDLLRAIQTIGQNFETIDWKIFSEGFLRGKYNVSVLKPKVLELLKNKLLPLHEAWSADEDKRLRDACIKYENNWTQISSLCFHGSRSRGACKLRWMNYVNPDLTNEDFSPDEIATMTEHLSTHKFVIHTPQFLLSQLNPPRPLWVIEAKIEEIRQTLPPMKYKIKYLHKYEQKDDRSLVTFIGSATSAENIDWSQLPENLKRKYTWEVLEQRVKVLLKQDDSEPPLSDTQELLPEPPLKRKAVRLHPNAVMRQQRLAAIAEKVFAKDLTPEECQDHYSAKRPAWLPQEDTRLRQTILSSNYPDGMNWTKFSKEAFLGVRTGRQCRKRFLERMQDALPQGKPWSSAEADKLIQAVATLGLNWPRISLECFSGKRGSDACYMKYKRLCKLQSIIDIETEVPEPIEEKTYEDAAESDSDTGYDSSQTLKKEEL